ALSLQMKKEERVLDIVSIEHSRLGVEGHLAEAVAIAICPSAMDPRTHHHRVVRARTLLLRRAIETQGAEQVFGIEPAADSHHRGLHIFHVLPEVSRLPVSAVG